MTTDASSTVPTGDQRTEDAASILEKQFKFLDNLRESGITNMYGAGLHLERRFGIPIQDANAVLGAWMSTFSEKPVAERVKEAMSK